MGDIPQKMFWLGQDVETLPRETLLDVIRHLSSELERTRYQARQDVNFAMDMAKFALP